jgi:hypothetical protein
MYCVPGGSFLCATRTPAHLLAPDQRPGASAESARTIYSLLSETIPSTLLARGAGM